MSDPNFEAWKNRAREADPLEIARRIGVALKRAGRDHVASCPVCGGKDRNEFVVTPAHPDPSKRWLCRKSQVGGDVIAMHMHVTGSDFNGACEAITGEPNPRGGSGREADPEAVRERRQEAAEDQARRDAEKARQDAGKRLKAADVWSMRRPIIGSYAGRYLAARGIDLTTEEAIDLGFAVLPYYGYHSPHDQEPTLFGEFPAMLAAIRDVEGSLIGVHRTYLDPKEPRKYRPGGDLSRNKAKKIVGKAEHGFIRLGYIGPDLATGEGIETVLSWARLGRTVEPVALAAAVSIGNLAGGATARLAHPTLSGKSIPNGIPDPNKPGVRWPDEVENLILLGDGDSDPEWTRATMLLAARRYRAEGRGVMVDFAPSGADWNNVLMQGRAAA